MSYVAPIISKFGGVRSLARALQCSPSTIQGWKDRGSIPDAHKARVLIAAESLGVDLTKGDFWPSEFEAGAISSPPGCADGGRHDLEAPVSNLQSSE